ncbi:hypothetical protein C0Q70_19974 [Pomacea canaliculata]|uniref:Uncharacterized protein n=1 Tax=Pomacea canaliculata TaxID=400727 RepID=A0A2T7NEA7_POMCA|nr:hypothetical protein C0Q70_19974 [Pomacea canaliculata]
MTDGQSAALHNLVNILRVPSVVSVYKEAIREPPIESILELCYDFMSQNLKDLALDQSFKDLERADMIGIIQQATARILLNNKQLTICVVTVVYLLTYPRCPTPVLDYSGGWSQTPRQTQPRSWHNLWETDSNSLPMLRSTNLMQSPPLARLGGARAIVHVCFWTVMAPCGSQFLQRGSTCVRNQDDDADSSVSYISGVSATSKENSSCVAAPRRLRPNIVQLRAICA